MFEMGIYGVTMATVKQAAMELCKKYNASDSDE